MDAVMLGIVAGVAALLVVTVVKARGGEAPAAEATPEPESAEEAARRRLREAHGVQELAAELDGTDVNKLPNGVYGFTYTPGMEVAPLFRKRVYQSFEMHKKQDGTIWVIGYLPPTHARAFAEGSAVLDLALYPEPFGEATELVAIPRSRVIRAKERPTREEGNAQPLSVGPKVD